MFHPLSTFKIPIFVEICMVQWQGNMVQITVPKKLEKQFRQQLAEGEKYVCLFTNLNAVDIKQRTYMFHYQSYMLQFQPTSKVQCVQSTRENIPQYAFKFCPLAMVP
jgi:hypothetical protein